MKSNLKTLLPLLTLLIIFAGALTALIVLFSISSNVSELRVSNVGSDSLSLTVLYPKKQSIFQGKPTLSVDGEKIGACAEDKPGEICYSEMVRNDKFSHLKINNLTAESEYTVRWLDTWKERFLEEESKNSVEASTGETSTSAPTLERVYGRVIDQNEEGVDGVLVYIRNQADLIGDFSAVTIENGGYSISYVPTQSSEPFFQEIEVLTEDGNKIVYSTSSSYNKPVADIMVERGQDDEEKISQLKLTYPIEAANTCISGTRDGGIRIQCNEKSHWIENLSTNSCPQSENRFRLGVIKHTDRTQFHKPDSIKLKLYDTDLKAFVKDKSGKELIVNNGGYVDTTQVDLVTGRTYDVLAFDGTTECRNSSGAPPSVTYKGAAKPGKGTLADGSAPSSRPTTGGSTSSGSGSNSGSGSSSGSGTSSGSISQTSGSVNLCKKVGENFAVSYQIPGDKISSAAGLRMRWGLGLITGRDQIYEYAKSVATANAFGVNMILRICYQGSCDINSGTEYGNAIVEIYDYMHRQGTLPQNGLFILAGHNEPNVGEYRDPQQEAAFVAEVISVVDGAGILSEDADDIKVKLIGPSMDLYRNSDGMWPGCSDGCNDPNPHPIYTAKTYIGKMLEHGPFRAVAPRLHGWGVNDYLDARAGGPDKVVQDVRNFTDQVLGAQGLSTYVYVTELGNFGPGPDFTPSFPWTDLANTIAELDANNNVQAILLFNSLGTNGDGNFSYHRELWNNSGLIQSLYNNCVIGQYSVSQEGTVPVNVERRSGGSSGAPRSGGSVGLSGTFSGSAAAGLPGGTVHGSDPCLGGICYGNQYQSYAVANGGILNQNFEGSFTGDNSIDQQLYVPQYWHAWYQNGCQGGMCGQYSCEVAGTYCRRPEYKRSSGFANRILDGAASAQHFASFATQHAGMYQHIEIGKGGNSNEDFVENRRSYSALPIGSGGYYMLDFKANGSSWSYSPKCDYDDKGNCVEGSKNNCICGDVINTFKGRIGIDPTGGIDPTSSSIVWTEWKMLPNVQPSDGGAWAEFNLTGVRAESTHVTLFVAANNEYPYVNSDVYWDAFSLMINGYNGTGQVGPEGKTYNVPGNTTCDAESQAGPEGEGCWDTTTTGGIIPDQSGLLASGGGASVLGASSSKVVLPERGEYKIVSESGGFEEVYISNFTRDPQSVSLFQDRNGNGVHDSNEYFVPNVNGFEIEKVSDVVEVDLKPGLNLVSIPLFTEDFNTAQKLVEEIEAQGGYVTSLAIYRNVGTQPGWNTFNKRGELTYDADFELRPNDGLYVVVQDGVKLRLRGDEYTEPVQAYIKQGWNLIAIKGTGHTYDSKSLLEELSKVPGVKARIAAVWDPNRGKFSTFVLEEGGQQFGEVVQIGEGIGIYVYVDQGLGYWTPN